MLCVFESAGMPLLRVPKLSAPLWHRRQSVKTTGRCSSFALVDPCGMWHAPQPSTRTGGCSAMFGVIIIGIGLVVSKLRTLPLFDLLNQLGVSLWLPLAIPMCLGLFYKRTPAWSSWTTVLIG